MALLVLAVVVFFLPYGQGQLWPPSGRWLVVILFVILLAAYALVRSGHLTAGIMLAIFAIEATIWASRWQAATHGEGQQSMAYLVIPVLLGGVLLRQGPAALVAGSTVVLSWLVESAVDNRFAASFDSEDLALGLLLVAVGTIAVVASYIVEKQAKILDESAQLLRQLAENIPEVFFIVSPDLKKAYYSSPAYEKVWGRPVSGYMADPLDWLKGIHPDDLPKVQQSLQTNAGGRLEFRVVHPSGVVRHMHSRTFPVLDSAGTVTRLVGLAQDVTESKLAADRISAALAKVRVAEAARTQLLNTIAHDLANPVSVLLLQATILSDFAQEPAKQRRSLDVLLSNARRVQRFVQDLKDLARLEAGELKIVKAPVDFTKLVSEATNAMKPLAEAAGVELILQGTPALECEADSQRLEQVLANFLGNALKFTPKGGTIRVRMAPGDGHVEVVVQDSGRGYSPEEAAKLFKPFSQAHDSKEVKDRGTGLGLWISKGIIESHGGQVWSHSDGLGRGSSFAFRIPC